MRMMKCSSHLLNSISLNSEHIWKESKPVDKAWAALFGILVVFIISLTVIAIKNDMKVGIKPTFHCINGVEYFKLGKGRYKVMSPHFKPDGTLHLCGE